MLASPGANVTIEAMRFAIDEGITIFVMHRAGEALAVLTDAPTVDASAHALELRRAQFGCDPKQRLEVARAILAMKIEACELSERRDARRAAEHGQCAGPCRAVDCRGSDRESVLEAICRL